MATDLASLAAELDAQYAFRGNVMSKVDDVLQLEVLARSGDSWGAEVLALFHQQRAGQAPDAGRWVPPVDLSVPVVEVEEDPDVGPVLRFLRGIALRRAMPVRVVIDPTRAWWATWSPAQRQHVWQFRLRGPGEQTTLWADRASAMQMAAVGLADVDEDVLAMLGPMRSILNGRIGLPLERGHADAAARSVADAIRIARG